VPILFEKVCKPKSRETISPLSIAISKDDSRQRHSLNHCFVQATIAPAESTFSAASVKRRLSAAAPTCPFRFKYRTWSQAA
jgi:hypothetical protein